MSRRTIEQENKQKIKNINYKFCYFKDADFSFLKYIPVHKYQYQKYNDVIITIDTETSKTAKNTYTTIKHKKYIEKRINPVRNIVVEWTLTIASYDNLLITVYGRKPSELIECITTIQYYLQGKKTIYWVHNLPYDHTFLRQYMFEKWGTPTKQLNIKSHYMLFVEFDNGVILRDSLILAQRKLEKWCIDLDVEHKKAVGLWDYNRHYTQKTKLTKNNLIYCENDTVGLAECLQKMCINLNNKIYELPWTATGIPRRYFKDVALSSGWKTTFNKIVLPYNLYLKCVEMFHGGYCHANRFTATLIIDALVWCFDFKSSYPYVMLVEKYPMGKYLEIEIDDYNTILRQMKNYSFIFKCCLINPRLKDGHVMPLLQDSKCKSVNPIIDNGRIIDADMVVFETNDVDFALIMSMYDVEDVIIEDAYYCIKKYLPKWLRDGVFKFFKDKCTLEDVDLIQYMISKGMLNSAFGMMVYKGSKPDIIEIYNQNTIDELKAKGYKLEDVEVGDFIIDEKFNEEQAYNKYISKKSTILAYQWGIYITSYAQRNLFTLGGMFETWHYSDTDSVYGENPDLDAINKYNEECKQKLIDAGYGKVTYDGKDFWLGVAENKGDKDTYTEFRTMGAKRYCGRCKADNELHLTVSGVPKKAVTQLKNDIRNFKPMFKFLGKQSGKLTHFYQYEEKGIDANGNEFADSIDLCECDYLLSSPYENDIDIDELYESLMTTEEGIIVYE